MNIRDYDFDRSIDDIIVNKIPYSIISAGTGAGKTTEFVAKLVNAGLEKRKKYYKVMVMLPTIQAVDNAYFRVSSNQVNNADVKFSVGYARDSEVNYHNYKNSVISNLVNNRIGHIDDIPDTDLVYATTGHVKNRLIEWTKYLIEQDIDNPKTLNTFDFIIIDEAHLRSKNMDIDIILGMLKYLLVSYLDKGAPKVILTSATYNENNVPTFFIENNMEYKANIEYISDFNPQSNYQEKVASIGPNLYNFIIALENGNISRGVILVFVPGRKEIETVERTIYEQDGAEDLVECFMLHGDFKAEDRQKAVVHQKVNGKFLKWKIIISTNIAETSLTIPDVFLIVDFPYEKIRVVRSNTIKTETVLIAKDSAEQRAGRTGRTSNGLVLRLISKEEYDKLPSTRPPEIERLPIANEMLTILSCNIDHRFIFGNINSGGNRDYTEHQLRKVAATFKELAKFNLITYANKNLRISDDGKFAANLQFDYKLSVSIIEAIKKGIDIYPVIVLAAMIESSESLFSDGNTPIAFRNTIPFYSIIKPWLEFCLKFGNLIVKKEHNELYENFCNENYLNKRTFSDARRKVINAVMKLRNMGYDVEIFYFDAEELFIKTKDILTKIYPTYRKISVDNSTKYVSFDDPEGKFKTQISQKFISYRTEPESIVSIYNLQTSKGVENTLWYPLDYQPSKNYFINEQKN